MITRRMLAWCRACRAAPEPALAMAPVVGGVRLVGRQAEAIAVGGDAEAEHRAFGVIEIGSYRVDLEDRTIVLAMVAQVRDIRFDHRRRRACQLVSVSQRLCWAGLKGGRRLVVFQGGADRRRSRRVG